MFWDCGATYSSYTASASNAQNPLLSIQRKAAVIPSAVPLPAVRQRPGRQLCLLPGFRRTILRRRTGPDTVYAIAYTEDYDQWRYAVPHETLSAGFNTIVTRWSMGEN